MGNSLDKPITEKDTCTGSSSLLAIPQSVDDSRSEKKGKQIQQSKSQSKTLTVSDDNPMLIKYGASSMQGWRIDMEDAHICRPQLSILPQQPLQPTPATTTSNRNNIQIPSLLSSSSESASMLPPDHSVFCVFDGHGGSEASKFASYHFCRLLCENQYFQEYVKMIMPYVSVVDPSRTSTSSSSLSASKVKTKKEKRAMKKVAKSSAVSSGGISNKPSSKILDTCKDLLTLALQHTFVQLDHDLLVKEIIEQDVIIKNENKNPNNNNNVTSSSNNDSWDFNLCSSTNKDTLLLDSPKTNEYYHQSTDFANTAATTTTTAGTATAGASTTTTSNPRVVCPGVGDQISWEEDDFLEDDPGTTGVAVLITPHVIICANLGDSRAVLCCTNNDSNAENDEITAATTSTSSQSVMAKPLSFDHKPTNDLERQRIEKAGGTVNFGRVDGELAVSRALGDFNFKDPQNILLPEDRINQNNEGGEQQETLDDEKILERAEKHKVSSVPDIEIHIRQFDTDQFVVLACDGIWDVLSNQECVELISKYFEEGDYNIGVVCEEVLDICLKKGSRDNMTIIVVTLPSVVRARV